MLSFGCPIPIDSRTSFWTNFNYFFQKHTQQQGYEISNRLRVHAEWNKCLHCEIQNSGPPFTHCVILLVFALANVFKTVQHFSRALLTLIAYVTINRQTVLKKKKCQFQ